MPRRSNAWAPIWWTGSTVPPTSAWSTARCSLSAGGTGLLPQILAVAERDGVTITDLSVSDPTLETVFINLTGKDLRE